jgi:hypothetical protein
VKTEEMKSMAEKIMLNLKLEMLNPLLQVQMLFFSMKSMRKRLKDNVYCKCNLHSSVSIEGGPAFSVNRPFSKSTHTGK